MTREDVIRMAREAGLPAGYDDQLERFAELVAADERRHHQGDIERWKAAAVTAEKWRGLAVSQDPAGAGRSVQAIQQEAAAAEREACAMLAYNYPAPDSGGSWRESIASAIRARSNA